ncbi:MAG TPA: glycosyltransferase family 4 protein [Thermoleophilaceae bacterium]|nr:glycosyltransferase family 4 protein [Thermoleophilaceae bacterium]
MRLLMTTDSVGGVWTYALDLVRGLHRQGIQVVVANMGADLSPDQREQAAAAGPLAIHESSFRLEWMDEPWEDVVAAGDWLVELAEREEADAVHLNSFAHGALAWPAPVLVVAHSCVVSWWRAVKGEAPPPPWRRYREAVRAGLAGADAVAAPTRAMLAELEAHYGVRGGLAIPNGSSTAATDAARKEPFVLAAGRFWDEAKNLSVLDEAARGLSWPVLVAGDGSAARNATALGGLPASELERLRVRASIFAAPARYEPFGLAALEAARAGCALVLGDIPSLREVWGDAALYVAPSRPDELRDALDRLIEDEALRTEAATAARVRSRRYTVERMARRYAGLYTRLARVGPVAA